MKWLRIGVVVALVVLAARAADLQILRSHQYQRLAAGQMRQTISLPAVRGGIYDRNGAVLAMSVPTKMVIANDFQITHPVQEALALAPLLGMSATELAPMLQRHSGYVVLNKYVPTSTAAKIAKDAFPGVTMVDTEVRTVPNGALASSVIGLTNAAGAGAAGLEYQYQKLLAGTPGSETLFQTPYGVALPRGGVTTTRPAVAGRGLELTLDQPLQYVTEQALAAQIKATNSLSGTAIVMDSRTGQILSMANLVSTTQKDPVLPSPLASQNPSGIDGIAQAQNNLAVTQTYLPGSVFKLVPFMGAFEAGTSKPDQPYSVPSQIQIAGHTFHDAEQHGAMTMTAAQILEQSSNLGTYLIASQLGESNLLAAVQRLGFGQSTGLNFPGESSGLLMNAQGWESTDIASLPIGQVDAVTPLQVLDAYNSVANGGMFVSPSIVRALQGDDGQLHAVPAPASHRAMSAATAATLSTLLQGVVTSGTGGKAAIPGYLVAGKTGTAAIPTPGQASFVAGAYNATFVGFAPADHPVLSAIVVLERPTSPSFFGGDTAAPVFSQIMSYALHRYGIPTSPGGGAAQSSSASKNSAQEIT
jgi:cell division protein FtsI (penicillin-binding protein 3)